MDFFERQDAARRQSKWLVLYFVLAVLSIVVAIYLVCFALFLRERAADGLTPAELWNRDLFWAVTGGTFAVVVLGSLSKTIALRQGGSAVAQALGGRKLHASGGDAEEQKLLNVVEEMALASGTAVPAVYLLDHEKGINAFAAGHSVSDAAIGVTRGALLLLSRDELQGVIAHEFSHILNGDMRLNLRLIGVVHGILCISLVGRVLLRSGARRYRLGARSRRQGSNPLPLLGLALLLIGSIGVFFGRLIKSAVSRQREFLADASAVQFTRNPPGIAGALIKIGGLSFGSKLETSRAEEASHLLFGNGLKPAWFRLLATHPPLEERIKAIDPAFDGRFPRVTLEPARPAEMPVQPEGAFSANFSGTAPVIASVQALHGIGQPGPDHLQAAVAWRESLPQALSAAVHDPARAAAVVYALLLSSDPAARSRQIESLGSAASAGAASLTEQMESLISPLGRQARLPLAETSVSALRELPPASYREFRRLTQALVESDQQVSLFEYALLKCIERHLAPAFESRPRAIVQFSSLAGLRRDFEAVLSMLARAGGGSPESIARAYSAALGSLGQTPGSPAPAATLEHLDRSMSRIAQASPVIKKRFLQACAEAVGHDGSIQPAEGELLRAIADAVDCPIPPYLRVPN